MCYFSSFIVWLSDLYNWSRGACKINDNTVYTSYEGPDLADQISRKWGFDLKLERGHSLCYCQFDIIIRGNGNDVKN